MAAFFALVRADRVLYFSNRRAVVMGFAAPILIAAFFGFLFGQGGSKPSRIPLGLTDLDRSELSQKVVAALRADEAFVLTRPASTRPAGC
jgi:ABC-2 type transport system permease protein